MTRGAGEKTLVVRGQNELGKPVKGSLSTITQIILALGLFAAHPADTKRVEAELVR